MANETNKTANQAPQAASSGGQTLWLIVAWAWAGIPLIWGISQTFAKAMVLFQ